MFENPPVCCIVGCHRQSTGVYYEWEHPFHCKKHDPVRLDYVRQNRIEKNKGIDLSAVSTSQLRLELKRREKKQEDCW